MEKEVTSDPTFSVENKTTPVTVSTTTDDISLVSSSRSSKLLLNDEQNKRDTDQSSMPTKTVEVKSTQISVPIINQKKLFVANLHQSTSEADLIKLFQFCGNVISMDYIWHKSGPLKGMPKGFAFIEMETTAEAHRAIARLNGQVVRGKKLFVAFKNDNDGEQIQFSVTQQLPQQPMTRQSSTGQSSNNNNSMHYRRQELNNPNIAGTKRTAIVASCIDDNIKKLKASLNER